MKRNFFSPIAFLALAILVLVLSACERQLQPDVQVTIESTPANNVPTVAPPVDQPTEAVPPPQGSGDTAYPGPEQATEAAPPVEGQPTPEATTLPTNPEATAVPAGATTYTVAPGDTLFNIGLAFGLTVDELVAANNLANPNDLYVGQVLTIPAPGSVTVSPTEAATGEQSYTVQPGDTLFKIGLRFGFTVEELAAYNNLTDVNNLAVGQIILIPPAGYTIPQQP